MTMELNDPVAESYIGAIMSRWSIAEWNEG